MTKKAKPQTPRIVMGRRPDPTYWQALGRFIEAFASTETGMFNLLAYYAGLSTAPAKALFSGTRIDAAIKLIRRIIAMEGAADERKNELEIVFSQLSAINEARNDIIHYGSWETTEGRMSTNLTRAHLPQNVTWRPISAEVLGRDDQRPAADRDAHLPTSTSS
jgi:hypothetical protein